MKIGVTGYDGFVGRELVKRGCIPLKCDITKPNEIKKALDSVQPDVIIHCAALTDVEYVEKNFKPGFEVNVRGTSNLVGQADKNTLIVYLSSDHIFPGNKFWVTGYNERATPNPTNRYGFLKWGGELALLDHDKKLIVRCSKLYNYEWLKPTIERLLNNETVEFTDVIKRSFMYLPHFVTALLWTIEHKSEIRNTIINISGESVFSYYMFWVLVQKQLELSGIIVPRKFELEDACPRPLRAGLDIREAKRLGIPMGSLAEALEEIKEQMNEQ